MPSLNHSYICLQILRQLIQNEKFAPLPELTLDIGKGLTPDISVFPKEKIRPNFLRDVIKFREMPILAVEVLSASQTVQELLNKASVLVSSGVKAVWTVEPYSQTIFITTGEGEKFQHDPNVESEGIRVNFREVFGTL
jgi:Uma2 family endonuclease